MKHLYLGPINDTSVFGHLAILSRFQDKGYGLGQSVDLYLFVTEGFEEACHQLNNYFVKEADAIIESCEIH